MSIERVSENAMKRNLKPDEISKRIKVARQVTIAPMSDTAVLVTCD